MKKKVLSLFVMLIILTMGTSVMAASHSKAAKDTLSSFIYPPHMMGPGVMQPNMMLARQMMRQHRGMMMQGYHGPAYPNVMKPYLFIVNQIPELRLELSLSDKEYEELVDLRTEYLQKKDGLEGELSKMNQLLHNELMNNANDKTVKEQLSSIAETKTSVMMAAYSTVEKMRTVMNSDQQKKLDQMIYKMLKDKKSNNNDPMFYQRPYYE
ncbi:hypothetical protein PbJCM13498_35420 [Prolixibacter bellariivorans]|uniref:Periplasmic heavy metal sensor n=1 Tax=Prolixibacter bellariivorans TaxID=314319 RepID=A0A5M4B3D5_9BACT|nr:hypothetical protein [Prolixibacter bellariivorans]GET34679.1 hypothetical protein PbJCM13498_35420 [Prolixibacter bellariivorans]